MQMTAKLLYPQIVHIKFDNNYFLASTFLRIQEFYESPFPNIRGKEFNIFDYMDTEARDKGVFDYFTKWGGFNFPSHVMKDFLKTQKVLYMKEAMNFFYIKCLVDYEKPFYVIGTTNDDRTIEHELAHAFYYLSPSYMIKMNNLIMYELSKKNRDRFTKGLIDLGYCEAVIFDEIQAYISAGSERFNYVPEKTAKKFREVFQNEKLKHL